MKQDSQQSLYRTEYCARLNRVVDYINTHLAEDLSLDTLAAVANFSKYHFHRIFSAYTGEALGAYIQRLRLEWAAGKLIASPNMPITEIALTAGFSGSSVFSRAFRDWFKTSPSAWRSGDRTEYRKQCTFMSNSCQPESKNGKDRPAVIRYIDYRKQLWRITMKQEKALDYTVEVKELPVREVAYIRHTGPYAGDTELFERLFGTIMRWAGSRGLMESPDFQALTIYHDSPEITDEEKLRISVCVTVPPGTEAEGEIGRMTVPGGRYAVGTFEIDVDQYGEAWSSIMNVWLPESGYQCSDHGPCYEVGLNDPSEHPEGKHQIEIHIPVAPL